MLRDRLAATRFQLDDMSACCEVSVGARRECEWLDGVYLEGPVRIPLFADGTRKLLQAPYHCYTGFFTQGATVQLTTGAQAQYHQTNEDGILQGDVQ